MGTTDLKETGSARENNFNIVRLVAALLVMIGHMGAILGIPAMTLGGLELHTIGVYMLFLIGGYLVTNSWLRDPHPGRYFIRRFSRFYPPFCVMVLVMTFGAGPLLSSLGVPAYFASWYKSYLWNLRFFPVFALPGVFEGIPYPGVVNGSLWTMPVEAALYLLLPLALTALRAGKRDHRGFVLSAALTGGICVLELATRLIWPAGSLVWYGTDWLFSLRLLVYYAIGMLYTWPQMRRLLNGQVACALMAGYCLVQKAAPVWNDAAAWIAIPYAVMTLALAPRPKFARIGSRFELSYGIYLYGFFFQQLVVQFREAGGKSWGFYTCLGISLVLTLIAAFLSCILVEKPCLALGRRLISRWKAAGAEKTGRTGE